MTYRLQLYMDEGATTPRDLARRLWMVLDSWRATDPRADGWVYETEAGTEPVAGADDCGRVLEAHAYEWTFGDEPRRSYEPTLFVGDPARPLVSVTYTCGIGEIPVEGIFAPSRLEALIDPELTADDGAALLQSWMLKAIEVLRPRFGHAGSLDIPQPLVPLSPEAAPPVGWLTYLSHELGEVPHKLPRPAVAYPAPDGTLLVATPKLFLSYRSDHREAVSNLQAALAEAMDPHV